MRIATGNLTSSLTFHSGNEIIGPALKCFKYALQLDNVWHNKTNKINFTRAAVSPTIRALPVISQCHL